MSKSNKVDYGYGDPGAMIKRLVKEDREKELQRLSMIPQLEPEIAQALEEWVIALMSEREGPGVTVEVVTANGTIIDNSWAIRDCFAAIYTVDPDIIARCLQAGGAAYIREEEHAREV